MPIQTRTSLSRCKCLSCNAEFIYCENCDSLPRLANDINEINTRFETRSFISHGREMVIVVWISLELSLVFPFFFFLFLRQILFYRRNLLNCFPFFVADHSRNILRIFFIKTYRDSVILRDMDGISFLFFRAKKMREKLSAGSLVNFKILKFYWNIFLER